MSNIPPERRGLLDTNVLISALLFGGTSRRVLERALHGEITLVTSSHLMEEMEALLQRRFAFSSQAAREVRTELESSALVVEPATIPRVCRDPDDDHVVAAGIQGKVDWIVTGDADLQVLDGYCGLAILSPSEFEARYSEPPEHQPGD